MDSAARENLVRRSIDAWNAADWEEQLRKLWSPRGSIVAPEGWPEAGAFEGWPAMVREWRRIKDSWGKDRVEVIEIESVGERVLGSLRWVLRGQASGAPLEVDVAIVCEFEGDRLSKMSYFLDRESARVTAEADG